MSRFKLQNRYQDSRWEDLGINIKSRDLAISTADAVAKQAMIYGMVRVIDTHTEEAIHTVPAGGPIGNRC